MKSASWPYRAVVAIFSLVTIVPLQKTLAGVTNQWTKTTSGNWEEPYWSVGALPSMQQDTVIFANPGYKALAIGPSTRAYPNSLSIRKLIVDQPSNLLLLNYVGMDTPLRVASDLVVGREASLLSYYSVLHATNFYCKGRATFAESSMATFNKLQVSAIVSTNAELVISNAAITAAAFYVGVPGSNGPVGRVKQYGGTMHVTGEAGMEVESGCVYDLSGGTLRAKRIDVHAGNVHMSGGRLKLSDSLWMYSGAHFQLQGGQLEAPEIGVVVGWFTHTGGLNTVGYLGVAYFGPSAAYALRGGTLISSNVSLGSLDAWGTFNQSGGVHSNLNTITMTGYERTGHHGVYGRYVLSSGLLVSGKVRVAGGEFTQSGGTNLAGDIVLDRIGVYTLTGGAVECENLLFEANYASVRSFDPDIFVQSNGVTTVKNQLIINENPQPWYYSRIRGGWYQLAGGTLNSHFVDVRDGFTQSGGLHSNDQILMVHGGYRLYGGELRSPFVHVDSGGFTQSGGTNTAGSLRVETRGIFNLEAGSLSTSNTTVTGADRTITNRPSFTQTSGTHTIQNQLIVDAIYRLNGGTLTASNIMIYPDGDLWLTGGSLSNTDRFSMYDGICFAQGQRNLGKLYVKLDILSRHTNAMVSTLDLQGGSTILRFQDSRDASAEWNGNLLIRNWSGSVNGGGADQVFVGTTAQGLTAAQLQRVTFLNPEGLPVGTYPARILTNGELLPATVQPTLGLSRKPGNLALSWSGNYELWTTTNLTAPWTLIPAATSPYTNSFVDPQRYFKLRLPVP